MPNWKKVILSGSNAHINNITASGHVSALNDSFTVNDHTSTELFVDGNITSSNLLILNTASITYFETTYQSSSIIFSSGSTKFGDTLDDTHTFTGSLFITGITYDSTPQPAAAVLTIDTASGRLYYTGSYGSGDSGGISEIQVGTGLDVTNGTGPTTTVNLDLTEVISGDSANRILTTNGDGTLTANSSFTYDGSDLSIQTNETNIVAATTGFNLTGNITASNNISASGNLFALVSDDSDTNFKTVMYDTSTGKFFRTGSYGGGGGGGGTPAGVNKSIQFNNSGVFGGNNLFNYDSTFNSVSVTTSQAGTIGLASPNNGSSLFISHGRDLFLSERATPDNIFGVFDRLNRYLCLQPKALANGSSNTVATTHLPSARLHVLDNPQNPSGVIIKSINQSSIGRYNLLLGTAMPLTSTGTHRFVTFHHTSGNDGGTPLNGGIYFDPGGNIQGNQPGTLNSVVFQGNFIQSSDKKLKKHITFTKKGIDDIMSIKVKDFRWKEQPKNTSKNTGFIAQDLLETHPEMIRNIDGTLNVEYDKMIPLLVKAIQDQQHQIDDLKEQLKNK